MDEFKEFICERCGWITIGLPIALTLARYGQPELCSHCGMILTETEYYDDEVFDRRLKKDPNYPPLEPIILEKYFYHSPLRDPVAEQKRIRDEYILNHPKPSNDPKCPTCGSYDVEPISTARKLGGALTLGLASKSMGKSYRCKNCNYYW